MTHRWVDGLPPQEGRLWRILHLAAGDVVEYRDIERRLGWPVGCMSHHHFGYLSLHLRRAGFAVRNVRGVGLRMVES